MLLFKSPHISVHYYEQDELLINKWLAFITSTEYRKTMDLCLELVKKHRVRKWVDDQSASRVISPKDQDWLVGTWLPKFTNISKLKRMGIVAPTDVSGKMSVQAICEKLHAARSPFECRFFGNLSDTLLWVREADNMQEKTP